MSMVTTIDVSKIKAHSAVEGLFPVDEALRASIRESMEKDGYSNAFPLHVIRNGADGTYLIYDGLTRLGICRELGIKIVPALVSDAVTDDEEILRRVIEIQSNRRSSSDEIQFICIEKLSEMAAAQAKAHQGARTDLKKPEGKVLSANAYIARIINKSEEYVKKARAVMKVSELKEKVISGELSLNAAYRSREFNEAEGETAINTDVPKTDAPVQDTVELANENTEANNDSEAAEAAGTNDEKNPKEKKISVSVTFLREVFSRLASLDMGVLDEIDEMAGTECHKIIEELKAELGE